jgi:hypothetical protein
MSWRICGGLGKGAQATVNNRDMTNALAFGRSREIRSGEFARGQTVNCGMLPIKEIRL